MTEIAATPQGVPVITADPFLPENLTQPHALHEQLREAGPVVYLDRYKIWAMARYEQVNAALKDWETFSSASGAGLSNFRKEKPWRVPGLLLEADPPAHTRAREIVGPILAPPAMRAVRADFESEAAALVDRLVARGSFDAVSDLAEVYPLKVFGDAVGVPEEGFDMRRNASGHVGFGMGIHRCVGQTVSRLEGEGCL